MIFDNNLDMSNQFKTVCRASFIQLIHLRSIKDDTLTCESLDKVTHAVISSRLDYCTALSLVSKRQCIQNAAARLLTDTKKFDHITTQSPAS